MKSKLFIIILSLLSVFLLVMCILSTQSNALAAPAGTITVNTIVDEYDTGGNCSLREAIQAANTDSAFGGCSGGSGDDIITLPAGTYTLTLTYDVDDSNAHKDLDISSNITINGAGQAATIIDGNQIDRVLDIYNGHTVELNDLTITNGHAPDSATLISDTSPGGNGGDGIEGTPGGGIRNGGDLTLNNCTISGNQAGKGGDGGPGTPGADGVNPGEDGTEGGEGGDGGDGGDGGGIYNYLGATLAVNNSRIENNAAGAGGDGGLGARGGHGVALGDGSVGEGSNGGTGGDGGDGGEGGGIYISDGLTLTIDSSVVSNNQSGKGGAGGVGGDGGNGSGSGRAGDGGEGGDAGWSGYGGGICTYGPATLTQTTISLNQTGSGGNGAAGGAGGVGNPGDVGGDGGEGGDGGDGGYSGYGSGIYHDSTTKLSFNSGTISQNRTGDGGHGGAGGPGGDGVDGTASGDGGNGGEAGDAGEGYGSGDGGGVSSLHRVDISNSVIIRNQTGLGGSGGQGGRGGDGGAGLNGGDGGEGGDGGVGDGGGLGAGLRIASLVLEDSLIDANHVGDGGHGGAGGDGGHGGTSQTGGTGGAGGDGGVGETGGSGGAGGGFSGGTATLGNGIQRSTISNNTSGNAGMGGVGGAGGNGGVGTGDPGPNGNGGHGGGGEYGGDGAGIYASGSIKISSSTVSGNTCGHGGSASDGGASGTGGANSTGQGGGGEHGGDAGRGCGIYAYATLYSDNNTISGNEGGGGGKGSNGGSGQAGAGSGGNGGKATQGGGVYVRSTNTVQVAGTTIADNLVMRNGGAAGTGSADGFAGSGGEGGGVYVYGTGIFSFTHTIIANNNTSYKGPDCQGTLDSLGYNLVEHTNSCVIIGNIGKDIYSIDPNLGPLGANGGPTATHLPLPGSPVLDSGNALCEETDGSAMTEDQRGFARPAGSFCDTGSVEVQGYYTLTAALDGEGFGSIVGKYVGYECQTGDGSCQWPFDLNTVVTLTVEADIGSKFATWSGDCSGTNQICAVTMDAARFVTATFDLIPTYTLTVSLDGEGTGNVSSDPPGIDCGDGGTDCSEVYYEDTVVTLTATPDADSIFGSWSGDCSGSTSTCQVTMLADKSVTATFDRKLLFVYLPLIVK
jgi:CSLREA domain-containing protein